MQLEKPQLQPIINGLKDDEHIWRHLRNFYAIIIIRTFHHCSIGVKVQQFHAYRRTIYCSQLWVNFNKDTYLEANVANSNMHSRIFDYFLKAVYIYVPIMFFFT